MFLLKFNATIQRQNDVKVTTKINSAEWLLTDGATGTNLFDMGLTSGDAPELWNENYPEKIEKLYKFR